ncbi:MAG: glycoside hydrolase family 88 protein [Candidatus Symbiothrix sp.]|jgi:rhamnogalacturonyl hydrolase YesR|nr:glycoside hydrolase family 88 protein [Candidatus Symbiothrix sp.]
MKNRIELLFLCIISIACSSQKQTLSGFPSGFEPEKVGNRLCRNFLNRGHQLHRNQWIHYAEVCTWYGALKFTEITNDTLLIKQLQQRFEPLFTIEAQHRPPYTHVDWNMFGSLALELYQITGEQRYFDLGIGYADAQWQTPDTASVTEKDWANQGFSWQTRLWIDDMFMITILQSQAYKSTGKCEYIDRAAREMVFYLQQLQRPNGLFFHSPEAPFYWARGNGWMAAGMTELLRYLPENNPHKKAILKSYQLMMSSLLKYQSENGLWNQLIDQTGFWQETSGSAMFAYALITGVKKGWLEAKTYQPAAEKAWLSLVAHLNENGELTDVCVGTNASNDRQYYYDRPRVSGDFHGQAPMLWCVFALLEK